MENENWYPSARIYTFFKKVTKLQRTSTLHSRSLKPQLPLLEEQQRALRMPSHSALRERQYAVSSAHRIPISFTLEAHSHEMRQQPVTKSRKTVSVWGMNTGSHGRSNTPLRVSVVHTHIHEHITDEAVAVGRAVVEDGAHHGVVEVVGRGVGDGLHHEHGIPEHVGVRRVDVAVDGVFHFGAELAEREHEWKTENNERLLQYWQLQTNSLQITYFTYTLQAEHGRQNNICWRLIYCKQLLVFSWSTKAN